MEMPRLETERMLIRPFQMDDLEAVHTILDGEAPDGGLSYAARQDYLAWAAANVSQLAQLHQPPYGDRAIVLKRSGELIGVCGFTPCLMPFEQLPYFGGKRAADGPARFTNEIGLYYQIAQQHRRQGYASEAARALIEYGFNALQLKRIVATTEYSNQGSIAVMRRLGMAIDHNPRPEPDWFQVVGILEYSGG